AAVGEAHSGARLAAPGRLNGFQARATCPADTGGTLAADAARRRFSPMSEAIRSYARNSTFKILSPEQEKKIHESCLQVLEQTGVSTTNKRLLQGIADHGQKVDFDEMRTRFDPDFVEQQRKKAPRNYTLHARNPDYDLPLGGERGWLSDARFPRPH